MTTLVTGATGNTGRHVVAEPVRCGERLRALTRNPAAAAQWVAEHAERFSPVRTARPR